MTVKELIEELQKQDQNAAVLVCDDRGGMQKASTLSSYKPGFGRAHDNIPFKSVTLW